MTPSESLAAQMRLTEVGFLGMHHCDSVCSCSRAEFPPSGAGCMATRKL